MYFPTLLLHLALIAAVLAIPTPTTKRSNSLHIVDVDLDITDAEVLEKRSAYLDSVDLEITDSEVLGRRSALSDTVDIDLSISDPEVLEKRAAFPAPDPVAEPIPPTNTPTIILGPDDLEERGDIGWDDE